jgi:hypothetical protein
MPPIPLDRLTDTELRDIVTYLVGRPDDRIFQRRRPPAPRTEAPRPPADGPLAAVSPTN